MNMVSYVWGYTWIVDVTGFTGLGAMLVWIFLILIFFPLAYVISVAITSVIAMPLVIEFISKEYPELQKKQGGSTVGSLANTGFAALTFLFWLVVTLPLWLIPGAQILVPLYLSARFNRKVFMYDVFQDFADDEERKHLMKKDGFSLIVMGMILGLVAYIPFAFIFLPVVSALAFTYFGFNSLQELRKYRQDLNSQQFTEK